jgi:hypothetical protein
MKTPNSNLQAPEKFQAPSSKEFGRCLGFWNLVLLWSLVFGAWCFSARAAFVYESPAEFLTSGDFNADGVPDVLVLDKLTGNVRVGYQNSAGALTWSPSLFTGAENLSGCGIEHFLVSDRDSLAVAARDLNRLNLIDLSNTNSIPAPTTITPTNIGPHTVIGLKSPTAPPSGNPAFMLVASSFNDAPAERLELFMYFGSPVYYGVFNDPGSFERGNPMELNTNTATFAVGVVRGPNADTLQIWQFTNSGSVIGALSSLPAGSDYAFGNFNNEPLPRFWFYVPGGTNVTIRSLATNGAGFNFSAATTLTFSQPVERVYVVGTNNDGSAMIQFGDGIQGARLPGGVPSLAAKYAAGGGKHFTGVAALNDGKFVLLSAPTGTVSSISAQVMTFNGTSYTQISSNNLSTLTTRSNRANVWLFQSEPFVSSTPGFLASLNWPDWSDNITGLPGTVTVRVETDAGLSSGLGSPASQNLGAPPIGSAFGLPDQYRDDVSLFSYTAPHPAETVDATISPPPGIYDGAVTISFTKQHAFDSVLYRLDTAAWQTYASPFALTHNATIQFYARGPGGPYPPRSPFHFAAYTLGSTGETPHDPVILTNRFFTNPPPPINTNVLQIAANGTVFYSRHSALAELSPGFQGPSLYLSFAGSPFNATGFGYFYLENFEDGLFNTPGATPSAGWNVATTAGGADSVDPGGNSYYSGGTQTNLTVTFNAAALGGKLPTHVGIVWTDVGTVTSGPFGHGNVIFSARDANGVSLGSNVGINLGDGSVSPSQAEDRFFGVVNRGGISSISITMTNSKDWEVDHLQYGYLDDAGFDDGIWTINLDGTGETFITAGARPRVTHDGHWMAFLREGGPVTGAGNIWVRDLSTGVESRFFTNTDAIMAYDWNGSQTELIFDNACALWRKMLNGPTIQLPTALTPECYDGAPVVNPVDGRLAFHNVNPGGPQGVYVTPPNWASRTKLTEPTTLRLRWPAWTADGARLAMADRISSSFINTGVNLWTSDGSNLRQITALTEPDGFPRGAIWKPDGRGLVGAGTIGGTNGLWIIPVAADGGACHCSPILLPTSPGNTIDFAGSIILAPQPAVAKPGLFIRTEPNAVVVYWSTNFDGFVLEYATDLSGNPTWTQIDGPYFLAGGYYEYHEAKSALATKKFFRLRYPGIFFLTPIEAELSFELDSNQAVLTWPADYVGYTLESTTSLEPPATWTPVSGSYGITNGQFEFRQNLNTKPREFFRLRWP